MGSKKIVAFWYLGNVALLLAYSFGVLVLISSSVYVAGGASMPTSADHPIVWILASAYFTNFYVAIATPALLLVLGPYWLLSRASRRPRLSAFAIAIAFTGVVAILLGRPDPAAIFALGLASLGFAALIREPGQTIAELPPVLRGAVVGFALGAVWLVGSLAAVALAVVRLRRGASGEAGAMTIGGAVVPGTILLVDLFRDDVPSTNYVVTALLLGSAGIGAITLLARDMRHRRT